MIECKYCKNEFEPSKYQLRQYKKGIDVFCSRACATASRYGNSGVVTQEIIDNIRNLFETTKLPYDEIQKLSNLSKNVFAETVRKYNLGRDKSISNKLRLEHMQNTMTERYGIINAMEKQEFRDNVSKALNNRTDIEKQITVNKIKQTKLEKYGDETHHNIEQAQRTMVDRYGVKCGYGTEESVSKRKQTSMERYGVDNPLKLKEIRDLGKKIIKERYGVDTALEVPEVRDKILETIKEKYGVDNIMKLDKYKSKYKSTMLDNYGVISGFLTDNAINSHKHGTKSNINNEFVSFISTSISKQVVQEKSVIKYIYDVSVGDNILIDINPTVSHNTFISYPYRLGLVAENNPVDVEYHLKRAENALENNFYLISVFDWDDWEKIKYLLQDKETLYARNLNIKEVSKEDTAEFLNKYHIQNTCKGQEVRIGLYKDDELIEIMTFGTPRYNKNYEWELLRLCTKAEYKVVGGAERLFKYFIDTFNPNGIISYCDFSKFTGDVYTRLGFKQKGKPKPSKHWSRSEEHITDNLLRQRGYDQLFGTNYGKGTSNDELMLENGWLPIYDCGQITFIWNK